MTVTPKQPAEPTKKRTPSTERIQHLHALDRALAAMSKEEATNALLYYCRAFGVAPPPVDGTTASNFPP